MSSTHTTQPKGLPFALHAAGLVGLSALRFITLLAFGSLHERRDRLGTWYDIDDRGKYMIFRETVGMVGQAESRVVLVVGFRLRVIGSNPLLHRLFQRVCILTTPFWSGFRGFHVKLWMVGQSRDYLGIYEWVGQANAQAYLDTLIPVLRALSTSGSVWHELHADLNLDVYLSTRCLSGYPQEGTTYATRRR